MDPAITRVYLTKKIAGIFCDTVEWKGEGDRAKTDWEQAECMVDERPGIIRWYSENLSDAVSYEEFEQKFGNYVWHCAQGLRRHLPRPPYGMITFQ
jgi:hypothetical protein